MTQLPAATSEQLNGMANVIFARLAAQLNSSLLHGATIALHLPLAVLYGREHPKLSGGPGADARGLRGPKNERRQPSHPGQRRGRATTSRSSNRLQ